MSLWGKKNHAPHAITEYSIMVDWSGKVEIFASSLFPAKFHILFYPILKLHVLFLSEMIKQK